MNANVSELKLAVDNLRKVSEALEKFANKPENYNSEYAQYLENLSFDMYKNANEIQQFGIAIYA